MLLVLAVSLALVGPACAADHPVDLANPPQGVFLDDWMVLELGSAGRMGYSHTEVSRSGDVISTENLLTLSLARMGQPVSIGVLQLTKETLDGKPLEFSHQLKAAAQTMALEGVVREGRVTVTSRQFGAATTTVYDYPAGAIMTWGVLREQHRRGIAEGTKYTLPIYDPLTAANAAIEVDVEVHERGPLQLLDRTFDAVRTTQLMRPPSMPGGIQTAAWIAPDGTVLKTTLNIAGLSLEMMLATKEEALKEFSPPEFFAPTTIAAARTIDRARAQRIDYLLRLRKPPGELPLLPATGLQKAEPAENKAVRLTVRRTDHAALRDVPARKYGPEFREYLEPNSFINSDDPAVREMAAQARGGANRPYALADNLRKYVTEVIKEKNLNVGFASASEVCRNREGDCSEHAVLLAALGRASGLPSRVAVGLVYVPVFGGQDNIFGFHMWTQFHLGEQWVDFDAAQRESDCNVTHIAFAVDSLQAAGLGQLAFPLVNVIGNLDLEIVRVEPEDAASPQTPTSAPAGAPSKAPAGTPATAPAGAGPS